MKVYRYNKPIWDDQKNIVGNEVITKTREQILTEFYPSWIVRMRNKGLEGTEEQCIEDFIIVNWAWEEDVPVSSSG